MATIAKEKKTPFFAIGAAGASLTGKDCTPYTVHYAYDTTSLGNGTATTMTYDPQRRWVDSYEMKAPGGSVLYGETLGHDAAGRVDTLTAGPVQLSMTHDELGRLTGVSGTSSAARLITTHTGWPDSMHWV